MSTVMISIGLRLRFGKSRASDTSACFNAVSVVAIISLFDILEAGGWTNVTILNLSSHFWNATTSASQIKKKNRKKTKKEQPVPTKAGSNKSRQVNGKKISFTL